MILPRSALSIAAITTAFLIPCVGSGAAGAPEPAGVYVGYIRIRGADAEFLRDAYEATMKEMPELLAVPAFAGISGDFRMIHDPGRDITPMRPDAKRVSAIMSKLQEKLIAGGHVTTRVFIAEQNMKSGGLTLDVLPGTVSKIVVTSDPAGWRDFGPAGVFTAIPPAPGEPLDLRDIEQGLENMKRVPTADADIKIVPGEKPGESELRLSHVQRRPVRLTLSADDSGNRQTGRYQGSVTLNWDNPLMLNDLLSLSYNRDLLFKGPGTGIEGYGVNYSLPFDYWTLSSSYNQSTYAQTVSGSAQNYVYSGESTTVDVRATRCIRRDSHGKTNGTVGVFTRASDSAIDDTLIAVQRRRTAGLLLALDHHEAFSRATVDASAEYRHGLAAFGAEPAPEEPFGEGTSKFVILTGSLGASIPLGGDRGVRYLPSVRGQYAFTRLSPQDRFAIGGRYTVKGFDGESILSGEHGWTVRQELAIPFAGANEVYLGIDVGGVAGASTRLLSGDTLCGKYVGVRGALTEHFNYDVFMGSPIGKPEGFAAEPVNFGFSVVTRF